MGKLSKGRWLAIVLTVAMVLTLVPAMAAADEPEPTEVLYLIDSQQNGSSVIFTVDLMEDNGDYRAELTEVTTIPYKNVDALACVPDDPDHILYGVNKYGAEMWSYNVETGDYYDIAVVNDPETDEPIPQIVLAAFSPDGTLFVACQSTNNLYAVSLDATTVENYGPLKDNGTTVNLSGADFAFDSDGNLFLWTNVADFRGLWRVDADDVEVNNLSAARLGGFDRFFTGLAFRKDGMGDLVGSETTSDTIAELNKDDGSLIQDYTMYFDGNVYDYTFGDMTSGPIVPPEEELTITKTVDTYYEREHEWDISKWVETEEEHTIGEDEDPKIWLYTDGSGDEAATWYVDVTYEGYEDNNFNVSGEINIENTGEVDSEITEVVDELAGTEIDILWGDDEDFEFPYILPAGETLTGTYDEAVGEAVEGDNVVTVTTEEGEYTAEEGIDWGEPDEEEYASITVEDDSDLFGEVELGTLDAADYEEAGFGEFSYYKEFAWEDYAPGSYTFNNTATIVETGQSASAVLKVNVQDYDDETAYAKGDNAICFIPTFSNWGWTNPIKPGEYTWDLWAGAAQCDTEKGELVGSVKVNYDDGTLTVEFEVDDDYILIETHVYAGEDKFPQQQRGRRTVDTVAPGQYYIEDDLSGEIYVIAHAVVGIPDPDFGPDDTNSESENDNNEANESEEASNTIEDQVENNRGRPDNPGSHGRGRR